MTNGTLAPSAIQGDTMESPGWGFPVRIAIPQLASLPAYTDLPPYWTWWRDVVLCNTVHKEDMWSAAVGRTATKFAAHGFTVKDSQDSKLRVKQAQELFKRADGGQGWVSFAAKIMQDLLTCDNGIFVRIRRADDEVVKVRTKATTPAPFGMDDGGFAEVVQSSPGAKITGLYHLDSLRCTRTGNLTYPVRYQPLMGAAQLLRWDQVLTYADMASPRAELFGVGLCAASRAYKTIAKLAAVEQLIYEFVTGAGANKLVMISGIQEKTLRDLVRAGIDEAQAKGFVYYLGTVLGAIPGDTPVTISEIILKALPQGFVSKEERDNAYLIYANAIGVPVQDIQPLSGQGLGTGTQTIVLQEAARGVGIAAFLKWWEQTVSDRVLPATTDLAFEDEHDLRDQEQRAKVAGMRATERATRIQSGEINPPVARQIAADVGDLSQELLAGDATAGGQLADDEKPLGDEAPNAAALALIQGLPAGIPPRQTETERGTIPGQTPATKDDALYAAELAIARSLARWAE
jgi:hypothetical protein